MRQILILWLICLNLPALFAQNLYRVQGYILSKEDSSAIINVAVQLQDSLNTFSTLSSDSGFFTIQIPHKVQTISILYLNQKYQQPLFWKTDSQINLGAIYLSTNSQKLAEVKITATAPLVRYEAGKAVYNLNSFPGNQGANALEAINRIPGIKFKQDKGFQLYGFRELFVLVDKRPMRMSASEIETYLTGLRASDIASVELIQNPGPQYASNGLAVLNIVTKLHKEDGYNAYANVIGRYFYYFNGQVDTRINFNKGISRSYLSYSFVEQRNRESTEYFGISKTDVDVLPRRTHQISLGTFLQLNKHNLLDINFYGTIQNEHDVYRYTPMQINENKLSRPRIFSSIQHTYSHNKLELRTTLESSLASLNQRASNIPLTLRDYSGFFRIAPTLSYSLSQQVGLVAGGNFEHTNYHNEYLSAGTNFRFLEYKAAGFIEVNYVPLKSVYVEASLNAVWYKANKIDKTSPLYNRYLFWLPRLTLNYQPAKNHLLALELRSNYERPNFRDITPIRTQSTNSWNRYGNIALNPSFNYSLAARYSFMQAAMLELSYSDTFDPIMEQPIVANSHTISLRKINLQHGRYFRAVAVVPVPLSKSKKLSWYATTTVATQYEKDFGMLNNKFYQQHFLTYYAQHRHDINVGTWTIWFSATIYGPLYYGLYKMKETWWLGSSVAKRIGNWRILAQLRDPLNTNIIRGEYLQLAQPVRFLRNWHQPQVSLMISYNIGNHSLKKYQDRERTDITDRMSSEGNEGIARDAASK